MLTLLARACTSPSPRPLIYLAFSISRSLSVAGDRIRGDPNHSGNITGLPHIRMMASTTSEVTILATPSTALVDDKVAIRIQGLQPAAAVTIAASLEEEEKRFVSYAHYESDQKGEVDIQTFPSLNGSYTGVEPMGLFWSMKQADGQRPGLRLMKKDVTQPFRVTVSVIPNHIIVRTAEDAIKNSIQTVELERYYMAANVKKINVKELDKTTRIRGTLFLPPGPGPFPGVVDMFGTAGGLNEYRAALLASRGFATLALAFFGYDDLPRFLTLELEYFVEAADWLYSQPQVMKTGIGVIGVSKGAELACHMAILNPKVKAVVPINTYYYSHSAVQTLGGVEQPYAEPDLHYLKDTEDGMDFGDCYYFNEVSKEAELKFQHAKQAQFLFLSGGYDRQADCRHTTKVKEQFDQLGMDNYRIIEYPKAGHLLEPPYTPLARVAYHKLVNNLMVFGGEMKPHADAQEHSWKEIQSFLWQHLTNSSGTASKL